MAGAVLAACDSNIGLPSTHSGTQSTPTQVPDVSLTPGKAVFFSVRLSPEQRVVRYEIMIRHSSRRLRVGLQPARAQVGAWDATLYDPDGRSRGAFYGAASREASIAAPEPGRWSVSVRSDVEHAFRFGFELCLKPTSTHRNTRCPTSEYIRQGVFVFAYPNPSLARAGHTNEFTGQPKLVCDLTSDPRT